MKIRSSAMMTLIASLVVAALGIALAATGAGLKFYSQSVQAAELVRMAWSMLAVVILLFVFGFVRYDLAGALSLGVAALHDQLLTLALSAIVSLALPLSYSMPALVVGGAVFTCCFSIPVIREARLVDRSVSRREHTRDEVAEMAVKKAMPVLFVLAVVALLIFLAYVVSGSSLMLGFMLPMLAGIAAAFLSATRIAPYVWAAVASRSKPRK